MKHYLLPTLFAATLLSGCATNSDPGKRAMIGAGVGAAAGALGGSAIGIGPVEGAAAGALVGGAAGALIKGPIIKGRQYYRDTRGYCYYVDRNGKPRHAPAVAC